MIFLCKTLDGKSVYYDPVHSHVATHLAEIPHLKELVVEALTEQTPGVGEHIPLMVDLGRPVGVSDLVEVDDGDDMIYAARMNRPEDGRVPFTTSRLARSCSTVAIWLATRDDGYELTSAWIGTIDHMPFPEHPDATPESKDFWSTHAFVWGSMATIPGTETTQRPW